MDLVYSLLVDMELTLFAAKSQYNDILQLWIEIKYNKSRLSKRQKQFKNFCRKMKLNHFTYRVTPNQLQHWFIPKE